jgi:hypothetical protein
MNMIKNALILAVAGALVSACAPSKYNTAEEYLASIFEESLAETDLSDKQKDAARTCFKDEQLPALIKELDKESPMAEVSPDFGTLRQNIDKVIELEKSDPEADASGLQAKIMGALMVPWMSVNSCISAQTY